MYADSYLIPVKFEKEKVENKLSFHQAGRTKTHTYELECSRQSFDVTALAYFNIEVEDSVSISKSTFTNSIQNISLVNSQNNYKYKIGYLNARMGLIYTPILLLVLIINLILNKKTSNTKDRKYYPYIWLTLSLLLLSLHLGIEYYFK